MQNHGGARSMVKKRGKKSGKVPFDSFFPDEIIMEIGSRLRIKDALRFQCVCKRFRVLMAGSDFVNLHIMRTAPIILVMNFFGNKNQFLLDRCWKAKGRNSRIHKNCYLHPDYKMLLSLNGLIVSRKHNSPRKFIVFNPIYREKVKITVPIRPFMEILGVFYQPSIKEYSTLWEVSVEGSTSVAYKVFDLGSQPNCREITNQWTDTRKIQDVRPVLVNKYLYWAVEPYIIPTFPFTTDVDIIEFDTVKERFEALTCPTPVYFNGSAINCNINLLNASGVLYLVQVSKELFRINRIDIHIWTLKDRENKIWTSSEYNIDDKDNFFDTMPKAIAFWDDELVLKSDCQELFVCNLKLGTTRKFGKTYHDTASFSAHVMSLASVKNCKSTICIMGEENNVNRQDVSIIELAL